VLAERIGTPGLLLVIATGFLTAAVGAAWAVTWFSREQPQPTGSRPADRHAGRRPGHHRRQRVGGIPRRRRSPYLLGISGYVLILPSW
jgi:hypothetical protein